MMQDNFENLETLAFGPFLALPYKVNYLMDFYLSLPKKQRKTYKQLFGRLQAVYSLLPIRVIIDEILERDKNEALQLLETFDRYLETYAKFSRAIFTQPKKDFERLRLVNYLETFAENFLNEPLDKLLEKHFRNSDLKVLPFLLSNFLV